MASNLFKLDDPFGFVRPVQDGPTVIGYPFLQNGDPAPVIYTRSLLQRLANYVPLKPGTEKDNVWPSGDPGAYNMPDGPLQMVGIADLVRFTRSYARIPGTQTTYGSRVIDRPVMHDIFSGSSYAVSFDNGATSHVFTSRKTVSAVGDLQGGTQVAIAAQAFGTLPGTSFTIEDDGGNDDSPNLNTAAGAMQSALETALVSGGTLTSISVATTPGSLTISWVGTVAAISTNATGVTMSGGAGTDGSVTFQASAPTVTDEQATALPSREISSTAHGGDAGDWCVLWNANKIVGLVKVISKTTDAFVIPCTDGPLAASDLVITHCGFAPDAAARYVNGPASVTVREVSTFYLPGVTAGIATPADIPLVAPKLDPISWLGEIVAASAYAAIEGSQLEFWMGGPIYIQTTISAQMSDALDTVAVGA